MMRPCDEEEERLVMQFAAAGCSCAKKCSFQFSSQYIHDMRNHCFDLSHNELDMVILGQLAASTNTSDGVVVSSRHHQKDRERVYTTYYHAGRVVCAKTFRFLHTIGIKRLRNLSQHLKAQWYLCAWKHQK